MKEKNKGLHFAHKLEMLLDALQNILEDQSDNAQRAFYIDLAKKSLIDLYEELYSLEKELIKSTSHVKNITEERPVLEDFKEHKKTHVTNLLKHNVEPAAEPTIQTYDQSVQTAKPINEKEEKTLTIENTENTIPITEKKQTPVDRDKKVLAETLGQGRSSIIDRLTSKSAESSLMEKYHKTPIFDLKKNIGLNDRFTFINDLFNGNASDYERFINELQVASDAQHIISIFNNKTKAMQWEDKDSFAYFKEIIHRYALSK